MDVPQSSFSTRWKDTWHVCGLEGSRIDMLCTRVYKLPSVHLLNSKEV